MNPVATAWVRACRGAPTRCIVLTYPSNITSFSVSRLHRRHAPQSQQAPFSSLRPAREAQRAHDNVSSVSEDPLISSSAAQSSPLSGATAGSIPLSSTTNTPFNSTTPVAYAAENPDDATKPAKGHTLVGRVSRVGTMNKTVRVSRTIQVWDRHLRKYYKRKAHDMVHDPFNILNEGDVVEYGSHAASIVQAPSSVRDEVHAAIGAVPESTGSGSEGEGKAPVNITYAPSGVSSLAAAGTTGGVTGTSIGVAAPTKNVKYVVHQVITPFGLPVHMRLPRTVGSPKGRWEGTAGEVLKGNVRQKARGKSKAR
ncbi:hypothetical protein PV08_10829 [Exophiala spinifera]|uniref:Ribosomal protein S17 n=1 Tax=Exophiala spinifera TaxID=91928 RepID=A0A0D2AXY0_9EURO|nr:uncharacterized protein PV08_10829 [Exophiala spinifera]KIW11528.1 hypothetical protein PV08_10829 [Exophiala spinifera]